MTLGQLFGGGDEIPLSPSMAGADTYPPINTDRGSVDWSSGGGGGGGPWSGGGGGGGGWMAGGGGGGGWMAGGGGGGWSSKGKGKGKGDNSTAMSALTLLAFLFFLNILQNCLKDSMSTQGTTPATMMMVTMPNDTRFRRSSAQRERRGDTGDAHTPADFMWRSVWATNDTTPAPAAIPQEDPARKYQEDEPPPPPRVGTHRQARHQRVETPADVWKLSVSEKESPDSTRNKLKVSNTSSTNSNEKQSHTLRRYSQNITGTSKNSTLGKSIEDLSTFANISQSSNKYSMGTIRTDNRSIKYTPGTTGQKEDKLAASSEDNYQQYIIVTQTPDNDSQLSTVDYTDHITSTDNVHHFTTDSIEHRENELTDTQTDTSYRFVADADEKSENSIDRISADNAVDTTGFGTNFVVLTSAEDNPRFAAIDEDGKVVQISERGSVWREIVLGGFDDTSCHGLLVCEAYRLGERWGPMGLRMASGFSELLLWLSEEHNRRLLEEAAEDAGGSTGCGQHIHSCGAATEGRSLLPLVAALMDKFL